MDVAWSSGQMKGFLLSEGLHFLFPLVWTCCGDQLVHVPCSPSLYLARVKSTALGNNLPVAPEEVS